MAKKGLKAVINFINNTPKVEKSITEAFLDRAVGRSVKLMERNIKAQMHKGWGVQEGHLRRSIHSLTTGFGKGEVRTGATEGGREINYAVYVEYGTMYMAPRAMFRKGVAASEPGIIEIFNYEAWRVANQFPLK